MPGVSVLIPAHNEEQNVATLVRRVAAERVPEAIDDILVIASGCTDATVARAEECAAQGMPVRVLTQERREGKASAINLGLSAARYDTIVLVSADVLPAAGSFRMLLEALADPAVGATGGRPVPLNDPSSFAGFAAHLMWRLHDAVSRRADEPKCGEVIAFRRRARGRDIVLAVPRDSAVDEVAIQALVSSAGLHSRYVPEAIIANWGPATLRDWFRQRRRVNAGHILAARGGYRPRTMSVRRVVEALLREPMCRRRPHWAAGVAAIEVVARLAAQIDLMRRHSHTVWEVARSTKRTIEQESR